MVERHKKLDGPVFKKDLPNGDRTFDIARLKIQVTKSPNKSGIKILRDDKSHHTFAHGE